MAEASLAFPAICLALSFLFVAAVYNASIMQHLGACHRHIILPVYQLIATNIFNRNRADQDLQNRIPLAEYEPINLDPNDEDEQHPPPMATSSMPIPNHHRHGENNALGTANRISESDDETETGSPSTRDSYRSQPRPIFADNATPRSPDEYDSDEYGSDEYDSDWSDSDESEPHDSVDDIPIWEFRVERPMFNVDHPEQGGPVVWLDEVVEWTSQGIFAYVAPELDE